MMANTLDGKKKRKKRERKRLRTSVKRMGSKWIERDEETEIFGKKQFVLNVDQIKFTMVNVIIPPK